MSLMQQQNGHVDGLVDAYALGALEPDEVAEVERHLEGCAACRELADEARRTADSLLYAPPLVAPPPRLRAQVLARIAAERAAASAAESTPRLETHTSAAAAEPEIGSPRGPLRRLVQALRIGAPATAATDAMLRELLADPASVVRPLAATADAPDASARLVLSSHRRAGVLVAGGLADPGADRVYQVWLLRSGQPLPNALFTVNRTGVGASIVRTDEPWQAFETIAVTPEPRGGSPAPTGPIVLVGQL
jgi:anti-sigma-K factor RskA